MHKKKLILTVLCIAVISASYIGLSTYDNFYPIMDGKIYRSAQLSGDKLQKIILSKKIKTIINLRGVKADKKWYRDEKDIARINNVDLFNLKFEPHSLPKNKVLNRLVELVIEAKKPILIHCWRGAERTGMASALILGIKKELPLAILKKEFSIRYGVLPINDSIGHLLFSKYEAWLDITHQTHDRQLLIHWLKNEYVDCTGNVEYQLLGVQYVTGGPYYRFDEARSINIPKRDEKLIIKGWMFDLRNKTLVADLYAVIDGKHKSKVKYVIAKPNIIKRLGLDASFKDTPIKWIAAFDTSQISTGCHEISFQIIQNRGAPLEFPLNQKGCLGPYRLCLEED